MCKCGGVAGGAPLVLTGGGRSALYWGARHIFNYSLLSTNYYLNKSFPLSVYNVANLLRASTTISRTNGL